MKHALTTTIITLLAGALVGDCDAQVPVEVLEDGGFEAGAVEWVPVGPVTLDPESLVVHEGCCAIRVGNRTSSWNGVGQFVTDRLVPGRSYAVSGWVRLGSGGPDEVTIKYRKIDESGTDWILLGQGTARSDEWREFLGAFTYRPVGEVESLRFYVQGPAAGVDLLVDSMSVTELDPGWRPAADARIEALRTRPVTVELTDADGCRLADVPLSVVQERNAFGFGTAINRNHMDNPLYTAFVAEHFQWAVMENAVKWRQNQATPGPTDYSDADAMAAFCLANDLRLRGHCVWWANQLRAPDWVQPLVGIELREAMEQRAASVVPRYEGVFEHWDVNNEMITNRFFADRLGPGVRAEMFQQVRSLDPGVKLFVNDFSILTSNRQTAMLQQVADLEAGGAEVDGIGAQGHFPEAPEGEVVLRRLDHLARAGRPIWITEFDCPVVDESARADALETVFRSAFSHPAVEGILLWGFWAGALNNGPDAALVSLDWSLTESGVRFLELMDEWSTEAAGATDPDGRFGFRGYHGRYRLEAELPGGLATGWFEVPVGSEALVLEVSLEVVPGRGPCTGCAQDLDGDGAVSGADLAALLAGWGQPGASDLDGSGTTDGADLANLLAAWGGVCD